MRTVDWDDVTQVLHQEFDLLINNYPKPRSDEIRQWLFELLVKSSHPNDQRIAVVLAFEAKTGNINSNFIFEKIFNRIKDDGTYFISPAIAKAPYIQFQEATHFDFERNRVLNEIDHLKLHEFYGTHFSSTEHPEEGYVRCLNLHDFFNFYVMMDTDYEQSADLNDYLLLHGWNDTKVNLNIPFPKIPASNNVNMRGGKPLSWITPASETELLKNNFNPATEIAKKLGIGVKDTPDPDSQFYDVLVLIYYDQKFNQQVYQPGSIHADWSKGGFVSHKSPDNCYGLTYNCCSDCEGVMERIHITFPVITDGKGAYKHHAVVLGRVNQVVNLDEKKILKETLKRFSAL